MKRKHFLRKGLKGLGAIIAIPASIAAFKDDSAKKIESNPSTAPKNDDCQLSPTEAKGPFPNKTPRDMVKENIILDRTGVPLLITLTIQDNKNQCRPLAGVHVDIWHCDKDGYYSEYGDHRLQKKDFRNAHFLRGRQITDTNGQVSLISIFPGWYPGQAPHIHVEVLDNKDTSLLVTQIAFPEKINNAVYATSGYQGVADTSNQKDGIFRDSLDQNMADEVTGNISDGYVLSKTIVV